VHYRGSARQEARKKEKNGQGKGREDGRECYAGGGLTERCEGGITLLCRLCRTEKLMVVRLVETVVTARRRCGDDGLVRSY